MTSLPFGTVMWMSNDALSRGWSLAGNHHTAMCGSFMVTTSEVLASQLRSPFDASAAGTPAYRTTTRNCCPGVSGEGGVMRSSWSPDCWNFALRPSTLTELTSRTKSRLNRDSSWVARTSSRVRPASRPEPKA